MTDNLVTRIAREWAEATIAADPSGPVPEAGSLAAARHILATTTPPTMADVEWDDEVHAGLCAEHPEHGPVRMTKIDTDGDIWFLTDLLKLDFIHPDYLTPIPGTRVDMTPRREPEPESTPDHPTVLTATSDYWNAPEGTVVAAPGKEAWTKGRDGWEKFGIIDECSDSEMSTDSRQVLRWGWEA